MEDIVHILELLRARAEANLLILTTRRTKFVSKMSELKNNMNTHKSSSLNITDINVLESWRHSQIARIKVIEDKLTKVEEDVETAKTHYKLILAKTLSAKSIVRDNALLEQSRIEEKESEEQLNTFRQNQTHETN